MGELKSHEMNGQEVCLMFGGLGLFSTMFVFAIWPVAGLILAAWVSICITLYFHMPSVFVTDIEAFVNCINGNGECKLRGFHLTCMKRRLYVTTPSGTFYKYRIVKRDYELGNDNDICKHEWELEWMVNYMTKYTFYKIPLWGAALRFARLGRDIYIDYKDTRVTLKRIRTKKE